jgi:hypothetical protein
MLRRLRPSAASAASMRTGAEPSTRALRLPVASPRGQRILALPGPRLTPYLRDIPAVRPAWTCEHARRRMTAPPGPAIHAADFNAPLHLRVRSYGGGCVMGSRARLIRAGAVA